MDTHLEIAEIIRLALIGEYHSHFQDCAFCREQYEDALAIDQFIADEDSGTITSEPAEILQTEYRLAAQSEDEVAEKTHVRRTWYFEAGETILRVMEDTEKQILYGHLITAPERLRLIVVHFSGIEEAFRPDENGLFEIGSATLQIEKMEATVSQQETGS